MVSVGADQRGCGGAVRCATGDITERILSELKFPSAKHLKLYSNCRTEHFKAALDAGTTTVLKLEFIHWRDQADTAAKLELLASFFRRALQLFSLQIRRANCKGLPISLPPHFFHALEACATVKRIQVIIDNCGFIPDLSPDEMQQLQNIMSRNRELVQFATNPGTYPTDKLPELMRQFDNCPTGRYMLARRLPEVLSFAELHAMHLSRRRTNPSTP